MHDHTLLVILSSFLRNHGIITLLYPLLSLDLNPIEHVWDMLERRVCENYPNIADLASLIGALRVHTLTEKRKAEKQKPRIETHSSSRQSACLSFSSNWFFHFPFFHQGVNPVLHEPGKFLKLIHRCINMRNRLCAVILKKEENTRY